MKPTAEELAACYESLSVGGYQEFKRQKEESRMHDLERIARGEATPEEMKTFRILKLEHALSKL